MHVRLASKEVHITGLLTSHGYRGYLRSTEPWSRCRGTSNGTSMARPRSKSFSLGSPQYQRTAAPLSPSLRMSARDRWACDRWNVSEKGPPQLTTVKELVEETEA